MADPNETEEEKKARARKDKIAALAKQLKTADKSIDPDDLEEAANLIRAEKLEAAEANIKVALAAFLTFGGSFDRVKAVWRDVGGTVPASAPVTVRARGVAVTEGSNPELVRPRGKPGPKPGSKPGAKRGRKPKAASGDVEKDAAELVAFFKKKGEWINTIALGNTEPFDSWDRAKRIKPALDALIQAGKIKSKGQKRGTQYHVA